MTTERDIDGTTVNQVINLLVYFHATAGGAGSGLGSQLAMLENSIDGVFVRRDDADAIRSALASEAGFIAAMDRLPLWKNLSEPQREVLVMRNTPRAHGVATVTVPAWLEAADDTRVQNAPLPSDCLVSNLLDDSGELVGWIVERQVKDVWSFEAVAEYTGLTVRQVHTLNTSARRSIRRALVREREVSISISMAG